MTAAAVLTTGLLAGSGSSNAGAETTGQAVCLGNQRDTPAG